MRYYCTEKRKGKRVAIAAIDMEGGCIALAESVFRAKGYGGIVRFASVENCKNFAGLEGPVICSTLCEAEDISERRRANRYKAMGIDFARFKDQQMAVYVTEEEYNLEG
jgi:hypothetical protein